jgi:hypothetical protein
MNDQDINAIPEEEEMSYIWMNENRLQVFSKEREELCQMLYRMLNARSFYLPEEVLSLSIDRKTYNFEEEISSSKIYMEDMQKNFSYLLSPLAPYPVQSLSQSHGHHVSVSLSSVSVDRERDRDRDRERERDREGEKEGREREREIDLIDHGERERIEWEGRQQDAVKELNERIEHIRERQRVILEERSLRREENNIYRRNVYLGQLNAERDPVLNQGPTERLSEVMKLSRGKKERAIVDLRYTGMRVAF